MNQNFIETIAQRSLVNKGMPFFSMGISLFGILFLHWDFQYLIILFIWEIFLMLVFAIIKMLFAMNDVPFFKTLVEKLFFIVIGFFIGTLFIVFSFMFMRDSINIDTIIPEIRKVKNEIYVLTFGYVVGLFLNYFGNQKYKEAIPFIEMVPFIHVLVILAVLQAFTGHLLPRFPSLNQAVWGIVALILVKFFVDLLFSFFRNPYLFSNKKEIPFDNKEYITTSKIDDSSHTKSV